jgi:protoheme IX farnesyltransferase
MVVVHRSLPATFTRSSALAPVLSVVADYVALTKPPIILLLLITALGGMFLAAQGPPPVLTAIMLMLGGASAAGGASTINHYLDRDVDGLMLRTSRRPIPGNRINPTAALVFGIVLNIFAFVLLITMVNALSAALTMGGTLFYVFVYTWWLKRTTPQNIVIGGAAGAIPPVAGWAAITGGLDLPALYLFGIVFFWTPPHFWALALLIKDDYVRAGIPMLPVVRGETETRKHILLYTISLVALTLLFFTTQAVGWVYFIAAGALGFMFLYFAWRLAAMPESATKKEMTKQQRRLYLISLLYLALLFVVMIVDSMVGL